MMTNYNRTKHGTAFTVSIEAARVSQLEFLHQTELLLSKLRSKNAKPSDLVQPGHIFPLELLKVAY